MAAQRTSGIDARRDAPLLHRTAGAMAWRFATGLARAGAKFLVFALLARLLPVAAFGLVGQAMVVVGLASVLSEIGLAPALIQRPQIGQRHIEAAFWLSTGFGALFTVVLWGTAPWAAAMFHSPEITGVLRVISLTFVFTSMGTTVTALLQRDLDFRRLSLIELVAFVVGYGGAGTALALMGYGVWALAWAAVIEAILRTTGLFAARPHSVRPVVAQQEACQLLGFGVGMSLARLANYVALNADHFVVGRWLGPVALGLYSRGYQVMTMPTNEFSGVVSSVLFPAYAEMQSDEDRLRRAFLTSVSVCALVVMPVLALLAVTAREMVLGVFGAKWAGAIVPMQLLCIGGLFHSMYNLSDSLVRARGAVYQQAWRKAVYAVSVFVGAYIGRQWGITGVAAAVVLALVGTYLYMAQLSLGLIRASWRDYFSAQGVGVWVTAIALAVGWPLTLACRHIGLPDLVTLLTIGAGGTVAAVGAAYRLPQRWVRPEVQALMASAFQWMGSAMTVDRFCGHLSPGSFSPQRSPAMLHHLFERVKSFGRRVRIIHHTYDELLLMHHAIRSGLWKTAFGLRHREYHSRRRQAVLTFPLGVPDFDDADALIQWLRARGVRLCEGGHTIYIPPQPALRAVVPEMVQLYPPGFGIKLLKDLRDPARASYVSGRSKTLMQTALIGSPADQLPHANYLHSLGIGTRIWDVACVEGGGHRMTAFVVDHVDGVPPTTEQCSGFLSQLRSLFDSQQLRTLSPNWEREGDYLPPDCNGNLIYSPSLGHTQYVDFQNLRMPTDDGWTRRVASEGRSTFHFGRCGIVRGGRYLYQSIPGVLGTGKRDTARRWMLLRESLAESGVSLAGRLVMDVGCNSGMMLHSSLADGAVWCLGWDLPAVAARAEQLLLSLGDTRFYMTGAQLGSEYRLEDDIPDHLTPWLSESVLFYLSVQQHIGMLGSLERIPWRVLVYEGHERETHADVMGHLKPFLTAEMAVAASTYVADGDSSRRPICVVLRSSQAAEVVAAREHSASVRGEVHTG